MTLSIPRHDTWRAAFDLDPFEGSDTAIRTRVETSAGRNTAKEYLPAGGWSGVADDKPFALGLRPRGGVTRPTSRR